MSERRKLSVKEREKIYQLFDGHCAYCGCEITFKELRVDHIHPIALGGADELSNMYPACHSCNHRKNTLTVEKFRTALERQPMVLMRDNVTYRNAVRYGQIKHPVNPAITFYFEKVQGKETK